MGQKRFYEVKTVINGQQTYNFIVCHSPKDFLAAFLKEGETAKAGKKYATTNGATIEYKSITKDYYESCQQTLKAAQDAIAEADATETEIEETPSSDFKDGLTMSAAQFDSEPDAGLDTPGAEMTNEEFEATMRNASRAVYEEKTEGDITEHFIDGESMGVSFADIIEDKTGSEEIEAALNSSPAVERDKAVTLAAIVGYPDLTDTEARIETPIISALFVVSVPKPGRKNGRTNFKTLRRK